MTICKDDIMIKELFDEFNKTYADLFHKVVYNTDENERRKALKEEYSLKLIKFILDKVTDNPFIENSELKDFDNHLKEILV